jgi:hypothetical protein
MLEHLGERIHQAAASGLSLIGIRAGWEKPPYTVVDRLAHRVEVRRYGARITAETEVAGEGEEAKEIAFEALEAYLGGQNRPSPALAGALPPEIESASVEIPMTAPVETATAPGWLRLRLFLPSRFTLATVPEPIDPRVGVAERGGETIAALRFGGAADGPAVAQHADALCQALAGTPWTAYGGVSLYTYDPPWTLPFLRRNEVVVNVEQRGDEGR